MLPFVIIWLHSIKPHLQNANRQTLCDLLKLTPFRPRNGKIQINFCIQINLLILLNIFILETLYSVGLIAVLYILLLYV